MNKTVTVIVIALTLLCTFSIAYATEPTEEEMQAFQAAVALYEQSMQQPMSDFPEDPENPPPTPEELKQQAILAFQGA